MTKLDADQHAPRGQRDGAARGDRRTTTRRTATLDAAFDSQGVFGMKNRCIDILGAPADKVRVLTGNVGGSFGMKAAVYPEYVCILHAARALGRPGEVDRRALRQLRVRPSRPRPRASRPSSRSTPRVISWRCASPATAISAASSASSAPLLPTLNAVKNIISMYRTPLIEVGTKCVFTNTTPVSAYRGAGRPEGNYYMERLIDYAAAEIGIDRFELRRRNFDQAERNARTKRAVRHHLRQRRLSGALQAGARSSPTGKGFKQRKRESKKRGKLRGLGIGCFLEVTARAEQGDGRHPLRRRRHRHHHHRHARLRPGPRLAVRAGADARSSAFRSSASAWCRATATS